MVVSGQWYTHFDTRDNNRRLVDTETAFARWRNPDELRGSLQHADEITGLFARAACLSSDHVRFFFVLEITIRHRVM